MIASWQQASEILIMLATTQAAGLFYLTRIRIPRPTIGRFAGSDVIVMSVMLISMSLLYPHLPTIAIASIFGLVFTTILNSTLTAVLGGPRAIMTTALLLGLAIVSWVSHENLIMSSASDVVLLACIIGIANTWVQTGASCRHICALVVVLTGYDYLATWVTVLTRVLTERLNGIPLAPILVLPFGKAQIAIGVGDVLVATVWPLVLTKSYGRGHAAVGATIGISAIAATLAANGIGWIPQGRDFPVLVLLGPAILLHYLIAFRSNRTERTVAQWRIAMAEAKRSVDAGDARTAQRAFIVSSSVIDTEQGEPNQWVAYCRGEAVGVEATPALARRAARKAGLDEVPEIVGTTNEKAWCHDPSEMGCSSPPRAGEVIRSHALLHRSRYP